MKFVELEIALTGFRIDNGYEWATVELRLEDPALECVTKVLARCLLKSDYDRSVASAHEEAANYAIKLLREAADILESRGPGALLEECAPQP